MILAATEPNESVTSEDFDAWYREEVTSTLLYMMFLSNYIQHLKLLSKVPGYLRSTRYQLTFSRTNLESKIMKGYATEEEEKAASSGPKPATWLALHEFDTLKLPLKDMKETDETEWAKRVLKDPRVVERAIYRLEHTHLKQA